MTDYLRLLASVTNAPLMVSPSYAATALSYLSSRMDTPMNVPSIDSRSPSGSVELDAFPRHAYDARREEGKRAIHDGVAVIAVHGALHQRQQIGMSSSSRGYDGIRADIAAALSDPGVKGIMLDIDSPGGTVSGTFALADYIAAARTVKPVAAISNESAFSAAYALAAAASTVYAPETSMVGSIGVLVVHVSQQKALQGAGLKVTFIHAGAHKVDGNSTEDLSDAVRSKVQARVDKMYGKFVASVARSRAIDERAVVNTEAQVYDAEEAKAIGLVDEVVGSAEHAYDAFRQKLKSNGGSRRAVQMEDENDEQAAASAVVTPIAKVEDAAGAAAAAAIVREQAVQEGVQAERARVFAILDSAEAKGREGAAMSFARDGLPMTAAVNALGHMPRATEKVAAEPDALGAAMGVEPEAGGVDATLNENAGGEPELEGADVVALLSNVSAYERPAEGENVYVG